MYGVDLERKEDWIPKTIGLPLEYFDFVVRSLQGAGGDPVVVVGQNLGSS
jgi:hypothetical protein